MPKNINISKSSSALFQNQKQIKKALKGFFEPDNFAMVEKILGSSQFSLKLTKNISARGTPRGLFTCGTMRIQPGHVVIVQGDVKNGYEIIACMEREDDEVTELLKAGILPADIFPIGEVVNNEDIFDRSDELPSGEKEEQTGGNRAARKKQEQLAAIKSRVNILQEGRAAAAGEELDIDSI